jgi:hypothetical protein
VDTLRTFLGTHRRIAALVVALALAMKALVPAGYMIAPQFMVLTVTICADAQGKRITHDITVPKETGHGEASGDKAGNACSWSSLSMASLGSAPPELLAIALAFIVALGFLPAAPPVARIASWLRPPLRGPPLLA